MAFRRQKTFKRFLENPMRVKKTGQGRKDTFVDKTEEELIFGAFESDAERQWLQKYAQWTSPGWPGPDVGFRSSLDPNIMLTTSTRARGRGRR